MTISERATAAVREMPDREQDIAERFRLVAEEWAGADAAFYMLDNTLTSIRAEIALKEIEKGGSVSKAQENARASSDYRDYVAKAAEAKRHANVLKARMDYLRMRERRQDRREWTAATERKMGRSST